MRSKESRLSRALVVLMFMLELPFFDDRLPVQEIDLKIALQELIPSLVQHMVVMYPFTRLASSRCLKVYPCIVLMCPTICSVAGRRTRAAA